MVKNITFIVIDALRAGNLSCYGYSMKTSPNIDNLAKEGVLFDDAYCCIPATDPSLTTIFSGKYPISHGIINHGPKVTKEEIREFNSRGTILLPEILKSRGYTTATSDWLSRWHRRGYTQYGVVNLKFLTSPLTFLRKILPSKIVSLSNVGKPPENAKTITSQAINVIRENRGKNFFLFIHYWDTHTCYDPPQKYATQYLKPKDDETQTIEEVLNQIGNARWRSYFHNCLKDAKTTNEVVAKYDGAIAFIDHEIGRLIKALEKNNILEQTLIILTSDHGESLTEHGIYFTHHGLYDETIHVPLIFRANGFPKNKRVKGFVQHVDVAPTIMDFLGIQAEIDSDGKSLIPLIYDETRQLRPAIYVEEAHTERKRAIRTDEYKYIRALSEEDAICEWCERVHGGVEELYDLKKDPQETKNIITENLDVANMLRKQLSDWVRDHEFKKEESNIKEKVRKLRNSGKI